MTAGLRVVILSFWVPDVLWVRREVQFQHPVLVPPQETETASQLTKETEAASKLTKEPREAASKPTKESTEAASKFTKETAARFQAHPFGILFQLKQRH